MSSDTVQFLCQPSTVACICGIWQSEIAYVVHFNSVSKCILHVQMDMVTKEHEFENVLA